MSNNFIKNENGEILGMGWTRDNPDYRDYSMESEPIKKLFKDMGVNKNKNIKMAKKIDLRSSCSPIENQGALGSCTANAGVGILEYYERQAFGNHIDASRLFLYKTTRNLLGWTGDTGAYLRSTMGALALFGAPPEKYMPYDISKFDMEPTSFQYSLAQNFQVLIYYRIDIPSVSPENLLKNIKTNLSAKLPAMFGFTVYSSISQAWNNGGKIPWPTSEDKVAGGHAVVAVGYDDELRIKNTGKDGQETTGAILIRNSWGSGWGDGGYGWLPYDYIIEKLAVDWWSLIKAEYVATGQFGY